ncbi:MAG TPA: amidohydrolase family protein [Burkholderiales bacterium]|nr:amidohydrolase family protein [Burkholderiales bacterium]
MSRIAGCASPPAPILFALALAALLPGAHAAGPAELPVFDAHIHYSHDTREALSVPDAVAILRRAGVRRALVSSSDDEGTQALLRGAPDLVLPALRPYRRRGDIGSWTRDESIVAYVEERLSRHRYVALGEFHVYGADAELPVVRRMVELARERGMVLHVHSDADAVERIFRQDPGARVLWAHAGFDQPENVRRMLRRYRNLWCDLSWRTDYAPDGRLRPEWRALLLEFPGRFLLGTDTPTAERWRYVVEHARLARKWLSELPREVAEAIAWRNGELLFGSELKP